MSKVKKEFLEWTVGKLAGDGRPFPERWWFYCPGCQAACKKNNPDYTDEECRNVSVHVVNVRDIHRFNGDTEKPTFSPSLMYNFIPGHVCHSFVEDGKIRFLGDCTHPLAGQTVDLLEIDE